jgi:hypothetical protein
MYGTIFLFKITYLCPNLIFSVKKISKVLTITILTLFIAGSAQSISADHLKSDGKGIFTNQNDVNLVSEKDSKYKIHLQVVVRDAQGQLISVLESSGGQYLQHELTDDLFDQRLGEKEIITIDGVKYEKVRITDMPTINQRLVGLYPILTETPMEINIKTSKQQEWLAAWKIHYCADFVEHGIQCVPIFQTLAPTAALTENDTVVNQWTVLREMN